MTPIFKGIHNGQKFFVMNIIIDFEKEIFIRMKVNMMKKIVFSKLWEYNTYYKILNGCFSDKWFKRLRMNKKWGNCERSLQRLESTINFNSLGEKLILSNQTNMNGHYLPRMSMPWSSFIWMFIHVLNFLFTSIQS
jgi:hypothetical protein